MVGRSKSSLSIFLTAFLASFLIYAVFLNSFPPVPTQAGLQTMPCDSNRKNSQDDDDSDEKNEADIPPFWFTPEGGLMLGMQVMNFNKDGTMKIPADIKKMYLEIGANSRNILLDEIPLSSHPDAYLITFEPILDKYAAIMLRYAGRSDTLFPLGHQHDRGVILPFAVSTEEAYADFRLAATDGCSSLMEFNDEFPDEQSRAASGQWWSNIKEVCATTKEIRRTPTVSLYTILSKWLPNWEIEYLKVDAQGFDLAVFESARDLKHRIKAVSFETVGDSCPTLYKGQPKCSEVVATMRKHGFEPGEAQKNICDPDEFNRYAASGCEVDVMYYRVQKRSP